MNGKRILVLALAVSLLFMITWSTTTRVWEPHRATPVGVPQREALSNLERHDSMLKPDMEEVRSNRTEESQVVEASGSVNEERSANEWKYIAPGDGSLESLMQMLGDPELLDACANLVSAPTEVLKALAERADSVLAAFQTEECERRVQAGLCQRIENYKPGEPFLTTFDNREQACSFYVVDGQAMKVDFLPKEYPEMYSLRDLIWTMRNELHTRGGQAFR